MYFLLLYNADITKKILIADTKMDMCIIKLLTMIAAMLSMAIGENCGYVRGPLASTNDTIVINLDCNHSAPASSPDYVPIQLHNNATHVAVQLVHCPTVPVGLFTNVTDNVTSVTVASEDAVQLLEGTFEGLSQVIELRLLGFTKLKIVSRSLLEPLRNIHTLVLDGFGSTNIMLSEIGSVIRALSGTPIRRLPQDRHMLYQRWPNKLVKVGPMLAHGVGPT